MKQLYYQGFWLPEELAAAAVPFQQRFEPRPDDVIVASLPKCGTTWVNALAFAVMARRTYPPAAADHPLLRLNPHECVPLLEGFFSSGREGRLDALPSPRLMNTHMPLALLPRAGAGCRVVYVCREPKDMAVSLFHHVRKLCPEVTLSGTFESVCNGASWYGPFWDHILGYWRASLSRGGSRPGYSVLFLRYEELLRDPVRELERLARFLGQPFSRAEEDAGVVRGIVDLCSLENLRSLEADRSAGAVVDPRLNIPRTALYRKGVAGDWLNHMTPEMARRMDQIVADRFSATGLAFN